MKAIAQTFKTDLEMMKELAKELKDVSRIKILPGDIISVEYNHNGWRDEFTTVEGLVKELQRQHMASEGAENENIKN
jgi:predicted phosphohydrolase